MDMRNSELSTLDSHRTSADAIMHREQHADPQFHSTFWLGRMVQVYAKSWEGAGWRVGVGCAWIWLLSQSPLHMTTVNWIVCTPLYRREYTDTMQSQRIADSPKTMRLSHTNDTMQNDKDGRCHSTTNARVSSPNKLKPKHIASNNSLDLPKSSCCTIENIKRAEELRTNQTSGHWCTVYGYLLVSSQAWTLADWLAYDGLVCFCPVCFIMEMEMNGLVWPTRFRLLYG